MRSILGLLRSYLLIAILAALVFPSISGAVTGVAGVVGSPQVKLQQRVVSCYKEGAKNGTVTIQSMRDCSGYWITPRALVFCILESHCPVVRDTIDGQSVIANTLAPEHLTKDSALVLPATAEKVRELLPPTPHAAEIVECNKQAGSDKEAFANCAERSIISTNAKAEQLRKCYAYSNEYDASDCLSKLFSSPELTKAIHCMASAKQSADALLNCTVDATVRTAADNLKKCIKEKNGSGKAQDCIFESAGAGKVDPIVRCLADAGTARARQDCIAQSSREAGAATKFMGCVQSAGGASLQCVTEFSGIKAPEIDCLNNAKGNSERMSCAFSKNQSALNALAVRDCATNGDPGSQQQCFEKYLPGKAKVYASCINGDSSKWGQCLQQVNPAAAKAVADVQCAATAQSGAEVFKCVGRSMGGDAARVAGCLDGNSAVGIAGCLYGDKKEVRAAAAAYKCVTQSGDAAGIIANCTNGLLDEKTRRSAQCVANAGGDDQKLLGCAAGAVLPADVARLAACAANSEGPTSFALCAAGPAMNEEWRIASECAVQSGGNPVSFAGCAAGRLTIRELTKCFQGQVGKDCYGPNNTLVKTVSNMVSDITHGPGEGNEIVKAFRAVSGGPNSVVSSPAQIWGGSNSFVRNPSQIWGGRNSVFNDPGQVFDPTRWRIHTPW